MDSLPPDFSAPPTFIEHTVFTRDLTGWPTCWSFDRQVPFRQNTQAKRPEAENQDRVEFGGIAEYQSTETLIFNIHKKKSYAYISPQSRNHSYRLAPMSFRPDDFPNYRIYFSGNLINSKNDTHPASMYLDSDQVLLTYYPSDEKQKYPKIHGNISKSLKIEKKTIEKNIIPDEDKILAIHKDIFLSMVAWESVIPRFPIYYNNQVWSGYFFLDHDPLNLNLLKHPIVFEGTRFNALWVLTKNYMYYLSDFRTKKGFSLETRMGDTINYKNIDLKNLVSEDGWLLRWKLAQEEQCREAFAPLVNSTVTPEEAKPVFIDKPKAP